MYAGHVQKAVILSAQNSIERLINECGLAAARHSGDAAEYRHRELHRDIFKLCPLHPERVTNPRGGRRREGTAIFFFPERYAPVREFFALSKSFVAPENTTLPP